jgi:hypothetical protein
MLNVNYSFFLAIIEERKAIEKEEIRFERRVKI